ncbi:MAG TPA: FCD domain-containing protein [Moraxellaceae bacterium]|nr:FCD domain-containing protein [Moraxellaceae bacterium]
MKRKSKPLGERLYEELCRDIIHGRIVAGNNLLAERKLAESRGLNRGAVREAMKRLAQMRLIRTVHGGGNRVEDWREVAGLELLPELLVGDTGLPDFAMLRGLLEMRASLAVDAARLTAQRATPEQVEALDAVVQSMRRRQSDTESLQAEVQRFWLLLARAAANQVYVMAFNSLDLCWQRYGAHLRHLLSDELKAVNDYAAIVKACQRRDPELAAKHARQLVQVATNQIEKMAANHQQRQAVNNGDLFAF